MKFFNAIAKPRPTAVHNNPCTHCPSKINGDSDPEMVDMKDAPREVQAEHAFVCGWRPEKICKGYCDYYGLTQVDFNEEVSHDEMVRREVLEI